MKIADWGRFQGYKKRGPDWIKLHLSLLDQPQYLTLPVIARAVLPALWITAARTSEAGELPDDLGLLAVLCHLPAQELAEAVPILCRSGFLICDGVVARPATELSGEKRESRAEQRESRVAAPAALAVVPRGESWTREACEDWISAYHGTAPGGRIGKALKPLVQQHGWDVVRSAWRRYLAQVDAQYASPQDFAAKYGRWSGELPASTRATVADKTRANLAEWVAAKEGR